MKILIADKISEHALDILKAQNSWEIVHLPDHPAGQDVTKQLRDADALIVRSETKVTRQLLEHAERLRVIGRAGVGVEHARRQCGQRRRTYDGVDSGPGPPHPGSPSLG